MECRTKSTLPKDLIVELSHTDGYSGIGQDDLSTLLYGTLCDAPCNGLFVKGTEDDPLLTC